MVAVVVVVVAMAVAVEAERWPRIVWSVLRGANGDAVAAGVCWWRRGGAVVSGGPCLVKKLRGG